MITPPHQLRERIGATVRRLRQERQWTLADLGGRLGISVSRLSEVERGTGSFTAEQLLVLFQLFHVGPDAFLPARLSSDPSADSVQNALVNLGATHLLHVEGALVREEHRRPTDVLRAVLLEHPTPRFLTACGPVVVHHADAMAFPSLQDALVRAAVPGRLGWLSDHVLRALERLDGGSPVAWRRVSHRARTVVDTFLARLARPDASVPLDLLDPDLRSNTSVREATATATPIDKRWRIVSRLETADFIAPLEHARDAL